MQETIASLRLFSFGTMLHRLFLSVVAGGLLGLGRSRRGRPAGLRTYMLICVGAAMCALLSMYQYEMLTGPWAETTARVGLKFDGARLAAQAITGIGFLGAGIIVKAAHSQVSGLTTATGLFASVCLGIAAGAGFYELVIMAVLLMALVLNLMTPLEGAFKRRLRNITINVEFLSVDDISVITDMMAQQNIQIFDIDVERSEIKGDKYPSAIFVLKLSKENHSHSSILSSLAELPCVRSVQEIVA